MKLYTKVNPIDRTISIKTRLFERPIVYGDYSFKNESVNSMVDYYITAKRDEYEAKLRRKLGKLDE